MWIVGLASKLVTVRIKTNTMPLGALTATHADNLDHMNSEVYIIPTIKKDFWDENLITTTIASSKGIIFSNMYIYICIESKFVNKHFKNIQPFIIK